MYENNIMLYLRNISVRFQDVVVGKDLGDKTLKAQEKQK
jgi:hypothetical protein